MKEEKTVLGRAIERRYLLMGAWRVLFTGIVFLCCAGLFAANEVKVPDGLKNMASGIYDVFTSAFLKTVIAIIFCCAVVGYIYNKDNEKVKAKLIAIMVGTALLMAAMEIVGMVWTGENT